MPLLYEPVTTAQILGVVCHDGRKHNQRQQHEHVDQIEPPESIEQCYGPEEHRVPVASAEVEQGPDAAHLVAHVHRREARLAQQLLETVM